MTATDFVRKSRYWLRVNGSLFQNVSNYFPNNSGWSQVTPEHFDSVLVKKTKSPSPFVVIIFILKTAPILVKMVQKSKFSKKSQTIPKLDSTSREQCLAISKQFQCSPNFSTRSDRWLFLTLIDGDHGDFENSQNFFESLNNSAKIFVKHCDVWETFGQTPKIQSLLVFFA